MRFDDQGIILSVVKYSESTAICRLFTQEHGVISGAVRGAFSRKQRGKYQPGNIIKCQWSGRLAEQLGSLKCEVSDAISAYCLQDKLRLAALNSALILMQTCLAEHDPHPSLYQSLNDLLLRMKQNDPSWLKYYALYELQLLEELGYRLELKQCAATGERDQLIYVSPKSGKAVSAAAGEPYRDKLLPLPIFMQSFPNDIKPALSEAQQALQLTGYFLEHRLFASFDKPVPSQRKRFVGYVLQAGEGFSL